jgi:hypothetical protein
MHQEILVGAERILLYSPFFVLGVDRHDNRQAYRHIE